MSRWKRWATIFFVVLFMSIPLLAFGQDNGGDPSAGAEFLGILFAGGLTAAIVQLLRRLGIVDLVPGFTRPLIAAGIGLAAVWFSNLIGVQVDLSPIAALFAAGGGGALLFGMAKEIKIKGKPLVNSSGGK